MIRVGILGGSGIASMHAEAVRSHPETAKLVAVAEIDPERRSKFVERWGVDGYATTDDLFAHADVDAVAVCLPHWLHAPVAVAAARAGKHLLIEKPMALDTAECDQIMQAAQDAGIKLMIALTRRFYPGVIAGRELIASGAIGQPIAAEAHFLKDWGFAKRAPWQKDRARGGGMWLGNAVHIVDGLAYLLASEITAVKGAVERRLYEMAADDFGFAWFDFRNGTHATAMAYGYRSGVYHDNITIFGSEGMLRCEREQAYLGRAEQWETVDVRNRWPGFDNNYSRIAFHLEWRAFLGCLIDDTPPPIPGQYGRHIVDVLVAAEQSTLTGREVRLDDQRDV